MGTFVGILLGEVMGAVLAGHGQAGVHLVAFGTIGIALLGLATSWRIPDSPAPAPDLRISANFVAESVRNLHSRKNRTVFLSMLGNSWFWFYGALLLSQFPLYAKDYLHGDHSVFVLLLTIFSLGIGTGSLLCEKLSGRKVEIGLVPFGAIGLSLFGIDLYFASLGYTNTAPVDFIGLLAQPGCAAHPGRPAAAGHVRRLLHRAAVRPDPDPLRPQARVAHHRRHEYPERTVHGGGGRCRGPAGQQGLHHSGDVPDHGAAERRRRAIHLLAGAGIPDALPGLAADPHHPPRRPWTRGAFRSRGLRCWCAITSAMSMPSSSWRPARGRSAS
jgi:hypothetical protein